MGRVKEWENEKCATHLPAKRRQQPGPKGVSLCRGAGLQDRRALSCLLLSSPLFLSVAGRREPHWMGRRRRSDGSIRGAPLIKARGVGWGRRGRETPRAPLMSRLIRPAERVMARETRCGAARCGATTWTSAIAKRVYNNAVRCPGGGHEGWMIIDKDRQAGKGIGAGACWRLIAT